MSAKLLVENLPSDMDDVALAALFAAHGTVLRAVVTRDPASGASTGAGEVEMESADQAAAARAALDATTQRGATLRVSPPPARPPKLVLEPVAKPERW